MRQASFYLLVLLPSIALSATVEPSRLLSSLREVDSSFEVRERGRDFAVFSKVSSATNESGSVMFTTNQFTLLENNLHYLEAGEWKTSEDLIEPFPGGAVARRGPNRAIFSPQLKSESVFDLETAEGQRIRGGVRAIQFTDFKTGRSVVIATIKDGVRGEVIPPNQVVYRNGFDGLEADVLFVWKHNLFSQNVILRKRPALPEGMDPASVRLEVVSELVESPEPKVNRARMQQAGGFEVNDDVTIGLGSMLAVRGKAFPVSGQKSLVLTGDHLTDEQAVNVGKEFFQLEDGRKFIIESVGWEEIQPMLKELTTASVPSPRTPGSPMLAASRTWPDRVPALDKPEPLQLAAAPYRENGYLVDLTTLPGSSAPYTFLSGTTYYIPQSFYMAGTATAVFQPGCVIKYGNDAWLLMHNPFSCPTAGQLMPVLTSKDDDSAGEMVSGSTHTPTHMASRAIWVYFVVESATEVRNMRIRWAKKGIEYDVYDNGPEPIHTVRDTIFQDCQTGVFAIMPDGGLPLINVRKCNVTTPVDITRPELVSGAMIEDCGPFYTVANFAGIKQQGESGSTRPDTMGAVGPKHFMMVLNAGSPAYSVAVYDKFTGVRVSPANTTLYDFFNVSVPSGPYQGSHPPVNEGFHIFDPQILFDHESQRWIACAMERTIPAPRNVLLAISDGPDPIGTGGANWVTSNWKKYLVPLSQNQELCADYDRDFLSVDKNGIYITANDSFGGCGQPNFKIAAFNKSQFVSTPPTAPQVLDNPQNRIEVSQYGGESSIAPAVNFDAISGTEPAWLMFRDGTNIRYNQLNWVGGVPQLQYTGAWPGLPISGSFKELDFSTPRAPQLGSTHQTVMDSRLMVAFTRQLAGIRYLWTCHTIGLNQNGLHEPDSVPPRPADRLGVAWYKIRLTSPISIVDSGRIYDPAVSGFKSYYLPSLAVDSLGNMVLGFSGSSASTYIGGYYWGRTATGSVSALPVQFAAGKDWVANEPGESWIRWGDYSATTLDPDGKSFWTIQQYAEFRFTTSVQNAWGTRIGSMSIK